MIPLTTTEIEIGPLKGCNFVYHFGVDSHDLITIYIRTLMIHILHTSVNKKIEL